MEVDNSKEYFDQLISEGYINRDGSPRKCFCGCTEFKQVKEYREEHYLVEFQVQCLECGKINGLWAYGSWEMR